MTEKKYKEICKCDFCGSEAEMVITCPLTEPGTETETTKSDTKNQAHEHQVKGSATCSHCGNEADMWVDL